MDLFAELRYAVRVLRKTPVFTIAAVATLALGIGANTTIFSLVRSALLQPLPYTDPDRLVMVWEDAREVGFPKNTPAPGDYNEWRAQNRSFSDMAATRGANASLTRDGFVLSIRTSQCVWCDRCRTSSASPSRTAGSTRRC